MIKKGPKHVEKNVDKVLSAVYFLEVYKYIESISIEKKGQDPIVVNFNDLSHFNDNYSLLDKLPTQVISDVSAYMTDVRSLRDKIFYYTDDNDKDIPLDIDIGLFTGI